MYICPNCQNVSETPTNFCFKCGTPMVEKVNEPAAPAYAAENFDNATQVLDNNFYDATQVLDNSVEEETQLLTETPAYAQPEAPAYSAPQPTYEAPAYAQPEAPAYSAPQPTYEAPAYTAPQPTYEAPAYTQPQAPVYTQPQATSMPYQPEKKVPLGKVIAGMAIAISGIFFATLAFFATLGSMSDGEVAFGMSFAYGGFFGLPLSLVGLILSKGAVNEGSTSAMAKTGKILGLIGVILAAVALGLGFLALIAEM